MTKTLPDKPSELITLALNDLAKVERSKKYVVDMDLWHTHRPDGCHVCLAGAVMAKSLCLEPREEMRPTWMAEDLHNRLCALDCFRRGDVEDGLDYLGLGGKEDRPITPYDYNKSAFKRDMRKLARDLAEAGL